MTCHECVTEIDKKDHEFQINLALRKGGPVFCSPGCENHFLIREFLKAGAAGLPVRI